MVIARSALEKKILDIIFISYDEPNAEKNWRSLKKRFPIAKRVHGIKGIANAHVAASKLAKTMMFYVVDADAEIVETFNFSYKPPPYDEKYVHIWHGFNPATGLDYGYGGVKLFNKEFFTNVKSQLDFSTTLTKDVKIIPEISTITRFNVDPFRTFRSAFREAVKLHTTANDETHSSELRKEARERLVAWLDPLETCDFRELVIAGATAGIAEARKRKNSPEDLLFINDHNLMLKLLNETRAEYDIITDPQPRQDNPMKGELFFMTRIAAVLYDPYVLENLKMEELRDALSDGQLLSKNWLVEILSDLIKSGKIEASVDKRPRVAIVGGWIGTLALMMNSWELPLEITSVDIDSRSNRIAEKLNYDFPFHTSELDMYDLDYGNFDIIINTSSEHIPDIPRWQALIPEGRIIIVQNNDFDDGDGHVSTVHNSNELSAQLDLSEVLYEGTRIFPQYSRFMIIGKK